MLNDNNISSKKEVANRWTMAAGRNWSPKAASVKVMEEEEQDNKKRNKEQ